MRLALVSILFVTGCSFFGASGAAVSANVDASASTAS